MLQKTVFHLLHQSVAIAMMSCCVGAHAFCTERALRLSEVPLLVLSQATQAVAGFVVEEAALIGEGVEATYELEGEKGGDEVEILISPSGEILRIEVEDD